MFNILTSLPKFSPVRIIDLGAIAFREDVHAPRVNAGVASVMPSQMLRADAVCVTDFMALDQLSAEKLL